MQCSRWELVKSTFEEVSRPLEKVYFRQPAPLIFPRATEEPIQHDDAMLSALLHRFQHLAGANLQAIQPTMQLCVAVVQSCCNPYQARAIEARFARMKEIQTWEPYL